MNRRKAFTIALAAFFPALACVSLGWAEGVTESSPDPLQHPKTARRQIRGAVTPETPRDSTCLPKPDDAIHLEGHLITAEERRDVALNRDGTPTRLSSSIASSLREMSVAENEKAYYVVRLNTLRTAAAKRAIESAGGEVLLYVREAAFLVRMDGPTAGRVARLPEVEWVGAYRAAYKISAALERDLLSLRMGPGRPTHAVATGGAAPQAQKKARDFTDASIFLFPGVSPERAASRVAAISGRVLATAAHDLFPKVVGSVPVDRIQELTLLPEVRLIERYSPPVLVNDQATRIIGAPEVWSRHGLSGMGQIVGHADSGLDTGGKTKVLHPDFADRIAAVFTLGREDDWSDPNGHGTHTAGSILGNGAMSGGLYRGVAPAARLVVQSILDSNGQLGGIPTDYGILFQQAYDAGARVHSNSWGTSGAGVYADSVYLDAWAWNNGHPRPMLIAAAAGNDGPSSPSVGSPATAKNCLAVGATENFRPRSGSDASNPNQVIYFSSRGPTEDGRIRPDVVTPGTWVASARSQGVVMLLEDDMEHGPGGWRKDPASSPWVLTTAQSRTPSTSWAYGATGPREDYLVSTTVTLPTPGVLHVDFAWKGELGVDSGVGISCRTAGGKWESLVGYVMGPGETSEWIHFRCQVPRRWNGLTVQFAVNAHGTSDDSSLDIYVDDVIVTSAYSWDSMWAQGLASRGSPVDRYYTLMGGTSMATPFAAGAAALVREFFEREEGIQPSAELVKAILINGATDLTSGTSRPNNNSGWGRINLENSLYPPFPRLFFYDDSAVLEEGKTCAYPFSVGCSSETLRATVVWADPPGPGLQNDLDLMLVSPTGKEFHPSTAAPAFFPHPLTDPFRGASCVRAADVDSDGDLDVVGAAWEDNQVAWWENVGSGSFVKHVVDDSFSIALSCFAADMDGDGDTDIVAGGVHDGIAWWENDGRQQFTKHSIDASFLDARSIYVTDMDGDKDMDVVAGSWYLHAIAWWENKGGGRFEGHLVSNSFSSAFSVFAADMNGDECMDVLGASLLGNKIAWWENTGAEGFTTHTIDDAFGLASSVYAADVDGDGDMDALGASMTGNEIAWWENDGEGSFAKHSVDAAFDGADTVSTADVDGDGKVDILGCAARAGEVAWWKNEGAGIFTKYVVGTSLPDASYVCAADLDGDGKQDILAAVSGTDEIAWWRNEGAPSFAKRKLAGSFRGARSLCAADLNGDGKPDLLGAADKANEIAWWENQGGLRFTENTIAGSFLGARSLCAADLDGDGDTDVAGAAFNEIAWWENKGDKRFVKHAVDIAVSGVSVIRAGDLDGDGDMDILGAMGATNQVTWWENQGAQGFTRHTIASDFDGVQDVYAADVDGDGDTDVLGAAWGDSLTWWENDGRGHFAPHVLMESPVLLVSAADMDGDGDADILGVLGRVAPYWAADSVEVAWWEYRGSGQFVPHETGVVLGNATSIRAADMDGDGDMDLVSTSGFDNEMAWWENNGSSSFRKHVIDAEAAGASAACPVDVNGDGKMDVVSATSEAGDVVLWQQGIHDDDVNNVECVDVRSPAVGRWTAKVQAPRVPFGPQPFAFVVTTSLPAAKASDWALY